MLASAVFLTPPHPLTPLHSPLPSSADELLLLSLLPPDLSPPISIRPRRGSFLPLLSSPSGSSPARTPVGRLTSLPGAMNGIEGLLARDFGMLPQVKAGPMAGSSSCPSPDPPSRGPTRADPPRPTSSVTPPRLCVPINSLLVSLSRAPSTTATSSGALGPCRGRRRRRGSWLWTPTCSGGSGGSRCQRRRRESGAGFGEEAPSADPAHRRARTTRRSRRRSEGCSVGIDLAAARRAQMMTKVPACRQSGRGCWRPTTRSQS